MKIYYSCRLLIIPFIFFLLSCSNGYKPDDPRDLIIGKSAVGKVKIGMSFKELKALYKDFRIVEEDVWNYGVDGGGKGLRVSKDDEILFFVWGLQGSDKIHSIVVLSEKYKTPDGIQVGMNVKDLLKIDPGLKVHLNLMTGLEEADNRNNDLNIVFESEEHKTIGQYDTCLECYSRPVNTDFKVSQLYLINE